MQEVNFHIFAKKKPKTQHDDRHQRYNGIDNEHDDHQLQDMTRFWNSEI